jgi:hypothetical protein
VRVAKQDTLLSRNIEILPPVANLSWEPAAIRAQVGDTVRLRAVARDSAGATVAIIPAYSHYGDRHAILNIIELGNGGGTAVVVAEPGVAVIRAELGHRRAEAQITVVP